MVTKAAGPRDRLLDAAQDLFYAQGPGVGVDAILKHADVARRSLYVHFGDKDGLVTAVLQRAVEEDIAWYEAALAKATDPRDRLLGVFDQLDDLVSTKTFRGCRYFATDLAFSEPDHPAHAETTAFRRRLQEILVRELEGLGHPDPPRAAEQLHLLIEGTLVRGATGDARHPGREARELAAVVLDQA
ncbi:TetR/AcrR family transcriptional regulator [Aeromicrobium terrae]|nr:TetR/AcrR family transcriptional regulator [Aeromicrobium terrae]